MDSIQDLQRQRDALQRAIELKRLSGLSAALDVKYQLIQGWLANDRRYITPAEYCPDIERVTGGAVRCEDLRPDVDWSVLRGTQAA